MVKTNTDKTKKVTPSFYQAVGRRKEAIARVRLFVGDVEIQGVVYKKGGIVVNGKPVEQYFPGRIQKNYCLAPFQATETLGRFVVSAVITGGGPAGQMGAFILGVARTLEKVDKEKYRPILKKRGFLTRDARIKERRKAGFAQKARAKKQSPKR